VKTGRKVWLNYLLASAFGVVITGAVAMLIAQSGRPDTHDPTIGRNAPTIAGIRTVDDLVALSDAELEQIDIAEMNLLCAAGLPGAEDMDIDKCLGALDRWAGRVKSETERHLYRLTDPRYTDHAEHYKHSEARFRAEWLISVLQRDIGLHYHAGFVRSDQAVRPPKTSKEHFIHGLMDHDDAHKAFGGNCVSLPVAYVAVGRRLGYPVKLVCSKEHAFCRWEGHDHPNPAWRDRFNFDGAGNGFSIDPDEFYLSWPRKSRTDQVELSDWLKSLTPQQELSLFLAHRGHVLAMLSEDFAGALVAFSQSFRLWPTSRGGLQEVQKTLDRLWVIEVASHAETYRRVFGVEVANGRVVPVQSPSRTAYGALPPRPVRRADPLTEADRLAEITRGNMPGMTPNVATPGMPQVPQATPPQRPQSPAPGQQPR